MTGSTTGSAILLAFALALDLALGLGAITSSGVVSLFIRSSKNGSGVRGLGSSKYSVSSINRICPYLSS